MDVQLPQAQHWAASSPGLFMCPFHPETLTVSITAPQGTAAEFLSERQWSFGFFSVTLKKTYYDACLPYYEGAQ